MQFRKLPAQCRGTERPAAANIVPAGEQIIERQADPPFPRRQPAALVERQDETQRPDQVWSVLQEQPTLVQGFVDQMKTAMLQITQPTVNQLRRYAACPRREIALVDQGDPETAQTCIESHPRPGDAAADDEQVKSPFRQSLRIAFHGVIL